MENQQPEYVKLIVVDVYDYDADHRVVTARHEDSPQWKCFFVGNVIDIGFGDHLSFYLSTTRLYLRRGPILRYYIACGDIPVSITKKIETENPYFDM